MMKFKEIMYVLLMFLLMFIAINYVQADDYLIDINSTGDIDLHLNFSVNPQENHYYSSYYSGSKYNSWDVYEDSSNAIEKAIENRLDNEFEFKYVYSLYNFVMWIINPYIYRIEQLEKQHIEDQERIFMLQKRIYVIEHKLLNLTSS